ncbi:MAG: hypothetical protein RL722_1332 [Pseudomonadota bacterium]|jgi:RNA polymerase sigma-70 factor (ECF subfamily)
MGDLIPHIPPLRRYARLLTGDAARADDLVQDTLERALRKQHLFRPGFVSRLTQRLSGRHEPDPSGLRPWLLTLMHNLWASQMRSRRDELSWDDDAQADLLADAAALTHPAPTLASAVHLKLDTEKALATLPDAQRAVLLLVVVEELSYAEVAEVLGIPPGTVMSRLSRARAAMRLAMEDRLPRSGVRPAHPVTGAPPSPDTSPSMPPPALDDTGAPQLRVVQGGRR